MNKTFAYLLIGYSFLIQSPMASSIDDNRSENSINQKRINFNREIYNQAFLSAVPVDYENYENKEFIDIQIKDSAGHIIHAE